MKVLDDKATPYVPSWKMTNGYLRIKLKQYRQREEKRRAEEEAFQQQQNNIYSWK
jgi:hypothetical protein